MMIFNGKLALSTGTGLQVDLHHTLHTSHQELAIWGNQVADAAAHIQTVLERLHQLLTLQVVEEETIIGSQPHTIIDRIIHQCSCKIQEILMPGIYHKRNNPARLLEIHHSNARTPGAYPQITTVIGSKRGNTVVGQTGICHRIMSKVPAVRSQRIESTLYGSYPQGAIRCCIHRIHGIRRKTGRIRSFVLEKLQLQLTWCQLGDATCFGAYPDLSILGQQAVYKVATQRIHTAAIPMLNRTSLIIYNIHTTEGTHQKLIILCDGKTRYHLMLERMIGCRTVEFLLGAVKQATGGSQPDFSMIRDDGSCISVIELRKQRRDVLYHQLIVLDRELVYDSIVAQHNRAIAINIAKTKIRSIVRVADRQDTIHLALLIEGESG